MADMAIIVNSNPAGINVNTRRAQGGKIFFLLGQRVVNLYTHRKYMSLKRVIYAGFENSDFSLQIFNPFLELFHILHERVKYMNMIEAKFDFLAVLLGDPARDPYHR